MCSNFTLRLHYSLSKFERLFILLEGHKTSLEAQKVCSAHEVLHTCILIMICVATVV